MIKQYLESISKQHGRIIELGDLWHDKVAYSNDLSIMRNWIYNFSMYLAFHMAEENQCLSELGNTDHIEEHKKLLDELYGYLLDRELSIEALKEKVDTFLLDFCDHHLDGEEHRFEKVPSLTRFEPSTKTNLKDLGSVLALSFNGGVYGVLFDFMEVSFYKKYIADVRAHTAPIRDGKHEWVRMMDMSHWNYYEPDFSPYIVEVNKEEMVQGMVSKYYYVVHDKIANHMIKNHGGNKDYIFKVIDQVVDNDELRTLLSSGVVGLTVVGNPDYIDKHLKKYIESLN